MPGRRFIAIAQRHSNISARRCKTRHVFGGKMLTSYHSTSDIKLYQKTYAGKSNNVDAEQRQLPEHNLFVQNTFGICTRHNCRTGK